MVRLDQIQHVHDAQDLREGIRQEIGVDRLPALVGDGVPAPADGLVEALVEQGEPADQGHGGGNQQGDADLLAVPLQVRRQHLALERVMDRLVTPLDLVPLQVDEHVRQAGDDPHEQRGQAAKDPRGRPRTTGHAAHEEEAEDDRQEERPRGPREQTLPEQEALPDAPLGPRGRGPARPSRSARSGTGRRPTPRSPPASPAAGTTYRHVPARRTRRRHP